MPWKLKNITLGELFVSDGDHRGFSVQAGREFVMHDRKSTAALVTSNQVMLLSGPSLIKTFNDAGNQSIFTKTMMIDPGATTKTLNVSGAMNAVPSFVQVEVQGTCDMHINNTATLRLDDETRSYQHDEMRISTLRFTNVSDDPIEIQILAVKQ